MKILLTGGAGFIGSHVVDALISEGYEVSVVDNLLTGKIENVNPAARFRKLDLGDSALPVLIQSQKFDYVIHHAAQVNVRFSVNNPGEDARNNIIGTLNLLQGCLSSGIRGIVFASSGGAIYGETEQLPVKEKNDKGPLSPYGVSKLSVEYYLYCFARVLGLPYIALRYGNVYGPRQDPSSPYSGVISIFIDRICAGEPITIFGDGTQTRDFIYVGDVVQANIRAMTSDYCGVLNIAGGQETSLNVLAAVIMACTGNVCDIAYAAPREGDIHRSLADTRRLEATLGRVAACSLADGLSETIAWCRGTPE